MTTIPAILDASREPISYEEANILGLMLFDAVAPALLMGFAVVFAVVARAVEVRRKHPPTP